MCIHYTSLVDRFIPYMTDLLRDANELLRKQSAMILASLISEDFIKFRGSIMLRFLYVLSDPSDTVRQFVECVFARILHQRNATMFSQNFLDVICALNGWAGLSSFQGAAGNEDFSLHKAPSRRAMIYRFMLALMSNDQKFNVCAQIVTTLLAAFVDSEEKIDLPSTILEPAGQVLSDGLSLLCCKEMRICFTTQRNSQDDEGHDDGGEKATAEAARGVLSSILKRNMCENIVPVLVQLKNLMEARHSPFLRQLHHCLREILKDFKDDLKVMLAGDPQLASEIAFDLQAKDADASDGAPAQAAPLPAVPHFSGTSRRVSLGTMMFTPIADVTSPKAPTCEKTVGGSPLCSSSVAPGIPKARRSSLGSSRPSKAEEGAPMMSPSVTKGKSNAAAIFASPTPQMQGRVLANTSPRHVPSLPVMASLENSESCDVANQSTEGKSPGCRARSEAGTSGNGKRRKVLKEMSASGTEGEQAVTMQ